MDRKKGHAPTLHNHSLPEPGEGLNATGEWMPQNYTHCVNCQSRDTWLPRHICLIITTGCIRLILYNITFVNSQLSILNYSPLTVCLSLSVNSEENWYYKLIMTFLTSCSWQFKKTASKLHVDIDLCIFQILIEPKPQSNLWVRFFLLSGSYKQDFVKEREKLIYFSLTLTLTSGLWRHIIQEGVNFSNEETTFTWHNIVVVVISLYMFPQLSVVVCDGLADAILRGLSIRK